MKVYKISDDPILLDFKFTSEEIKEIKLFILDLIAKRNEVTKQYNEETINDYRRIINTLNTFSISSDSDDEPSYHLR
jgi:hypothetical protein